MHVHGARHGGRSFITVEVVAALGLLTALVAITATAVVQYRQAREFDTWRQAAAWAAEAQLQRYRAGAAIDSPPPPGLLPEAVSIGTHVEPGEGDWTGFRLVTVTGTVTRHGRKPIRQRVAGYFSAEGSP